MADSGAISSLLGDEQGKSIPIPPPAAAPTAPPSQPAQAQPPAAAPQAPAQPGFAATPVGEKIAQAESGDRNIPNYAFDQTHTAGGHFQITDTNWKRYAPQVGIDISKYPNAMSAPEQLQGQVAGKMYADMGIMPWSMNPRLATHSLAYDWSKLSPQEQKMMGERSAATNDIVQRLSGLQLEYAREAAAAEPGSKERDALISKYRQNLEEMQSEWRQKVASPPIEKPIDAFANLGSPAVILSLLGGLLSRQHLTAGLNAAGSALTAINTNNHEQFEKAYQTWKTQTELGLQMINMENQDIRSLLDDKRMAVDEKNARLQTLAAEMGFMGKSGALQLDNIDSASTFVARREQLGMQMQQHMDQIESLNAYRQQTHEDRMAALSARASGPEQLETSKMYDIVDDKGKVVRTVMAREKKGEAGFIDSQTGQPLDLKSGEHMKQITPTTSGGGRAGAQVLRQEIGGREVLSDLQNVSKLPVGSTIGTFGTYQAGTSIAGALHGDLVRKLTDQNAQLMQASLASMTRELSVLMSPVYGGNYAAQQIEPLVPKAGDTLGTTIFKMARIAQSADNALEAISKSPILSNDQQEYATDLRKQIQEAIPWSAQQALEFAHQGDTRESFGDFIRKHSSSGGGKYHVGQTLTVNGKQYRVTGGDLNADPDVEPVQ